MSSLEERPAAPPSRCFGLLNRRERWGLSLRGVGCLVLLALGLAAGFALGVYPFLGVTKRVEADVLVVEGWIHDYAVRASLLEFTEGRYREVIATGGPFPGTGPFVNVHQTTAGVTGARLVALGIAPERVRIVPTRTVDRDRTYNSALELRKWARQQGRELRSINIVTEAFHARRTRMLFQMALGADVEVGIIAIPNPDYNPMRWWKVSEGVREVLSESIAYLYARFIFSPAS